MRGSLPVYQLLLAMGLPVAVVGCGTPGAVHGAHRRSICPRPWVGVYGGPTFGSVRTGQVIRGWVCAVRCYLDDRAVPCGWTADSRIRCRAPEPIEQTGAAERIVECSERYPYPRTLQISKIQWSEPDGEPGPSVAPFTTCCDSPNSRPPAPPFRICPDDPAPETEGSVWSSQDSSLGWTGRWRCDDVPPASRIMEMRGRQVTIRHVPLEGRP